MFYLSVGLKGIDRSWNALRLVVSGRYIVWVFLFETAIYRFNAPGKRYIIHLCQNSHQQGSSVFDCSSPGMQAAPTRPDLSCVFFFRDRTRFPFPLLFFSLPEFLDFMLFKKTILCGGNKTDRTIPVHVLHQLAAESKWKYGETTLSLAQIMANSGEAHVANRWQPWTSHSLR